MPTAPRPVHSPPFTLTAWLRFDLAAREIERAGPVRDVLEIGPGAGAMAMWLASRFDYTGVERDPASAALARSRLASVGGGRIVESLDAVVADRRFDLVCAFEVLEHFEDDGAALAQWAACLRPGGRLVLSVPAYQRRYNAWDEQVGHYRRYEPEGLRALLAKSGFDDVHVSPYGYPLGTALEAVRHRLVARKGRPDVAADASMDERTTGSGRLLQPPPAAAVVLRGLSLPFRAVQHRFPERGIGLVAGGRRMP